jgi:hypothetical protein
LLALLLDHTQEGIDNVGIELPPALAFDFSDGFFDRPCRLVGPLLREGVENVRNGDDPACERYLIAGEAGVSPPVPLLVMAECDFFRQPQQREAAP